MARISQVRRCAEAATSTGFRSSFDRPAAHIAADIERLIGTLMQRVHTLPGTTYCNPVERGDYRSEMAARFTLKELKYWSALEICMHYNGRSQSSTDCVLWIVLPHSKPVESVT